MSDTDLIVPVQVHALVVNDRVKSSEVFHRWTLNFDAMLGEDKKPAEPPPGDTEDIEYGVYVQWQLPEALTAGHYDPDSEETTFPLVPNRWLVVRNYTVPGGFPGEGRRRAAAWVVHSDYLEFAHYDGELGWGSVQFLSEDPETRQVRTDWLGRAHDLRTGPWTEPDREIDPFLTAVGPGVPAFAGFQPYQQNVFSFHDSLLDLEGNGHNVPASTTLSYLVVGWYSDDDADILKHAGDIPDLLPPDEEDPLKAVLAGLGWHLPGLTELPDDSGEGESDGRADVPRPQRSIYAGTALGIDWEFYAVEMPPSDPRPGHESLKVAIGHSTADALEALTAHQTRSARAGTLLSALYSGTIDSLDEGDGEVDFEEVTRRAWFSSKGGGYTWQIVPRPAEGDEPLRGTVTPPTWLDELNAHQAEYEAFALELGHVQERLRTLWWLKGMPDCTPEFEQAAEAEFKEAVPGTLAHRAVAAADGMKRLIEIDKLPHATTPEKLQPLIDAYAAEKELPDTLELRRVAREPYYSPADPAMIIAGGGVAQPLTRDTPLPCRLPSGLVESLVINGVPVTPPEPPPLNLAEAAPPPARRGQVAPPPVLTAQTAPLDLGELPAPVDVLLREFALFDLAAITPADDGSGRSALEVALEEPDHVVGTPAEYTAVWGQPWLPMYVQWDLRYHHIPYQSEGHANWSFDGHSYDWLGTGADPGDGISGPTWLPFVNRAFVTPAVPYVLSSQIDRLLDTYTPGDAAALRSLRSDYRDMNLLSQTLDGFNDHLLMRDTGVRAVTPEEIARLTGEAGHVPALKGFEEYTQSRFQPLRAGQLYFRDLRIIDRFGRCVVITHPGKDDEERFLQFRPIRADSVTPSMHLGDDIQAPSRFIQLPPRLLQEARVRLEITRGRDDTLLAAGRATPVGVDSPMVGWLLVNYLDENLLVYGPDGDPVGELRIIRPIEDDIEDDSAVAFTPLPGSPYRSESDPDFADDHPHLSRFVKELVGPTGPYEALLATIDQTLETVVDPAAEDDRTPARLTGRPVALYRTRLNLELRGESLTDPGWEHALEPPDEDYPTYAWPIRLGEPDRLSDGLIGYYAVGPDEETDYSRLHVVTPATNDPYLSEIGTGEGLALPARPPGDSEHVHYLTILADPQVPVHATTDILPVAELKLPGDLVHQALRRIRAAFRLNPLLAPVRVPATEQEESRSEESAEEHLVLVRPAAHHGTWTWAQPYTDPGDGGLSWQELPLLAADGQARPDDPPPQARAGYLLLHPAGDFAE
ncbi:hypothetical protein [Streptosporangium sp. NPDC000396]|uniref:hypothetical protein n=1 Tax=Streptosporangium sp. NPDC000396 TaxID=3366185 RepID=UPI003692EB3F